ncbi:MAG: SDR family oxidoreductase [Gallionellaceae bacterium]|jgi:NAD(P)-dependent dehydrogenase (short-subunit alcohol dehydrogenase family)|nr:SDR family oxidoreductase [Gallionellaceae bacterium]
MQTGQQTVFITGASSGLGLALAEHYLDRGAVVGVAARRSDPLRHLAEQYPGRVQLYPLDVRDAAALQSAAQHFILHVGAPDIVIANAGVSIGTLTRYAEDNDVFQQVVDINLIGVVKTFQPFLDVMREAKRGKLVGIASVAGFRGLRGSGAYSASKAALISYMESLRLELHGSGVNSITICPGYIRTPLTDINPYSMPFILEADEAAQRIARVIESGKAFAVVPWQMAMVGRVMKWLPNCLYDALFSRAPRKPRKTERDS